MTYEDDHLKLDRICYPFRIYGSFTGTGQRNSIYHSRIHMELWKDIVSDVFLC